MLRLLFILFMTLLISCEDSKENEKRDSDDQSTEFNEPDSDISSLCGNGTVDEGELCDGNVISCSDISSDYIDGEATCKNNCMEYNTDNCIDCSCDLDEFNSIPTYDAWHQLKMIGLINDDKEDDPESAFIVNSTTRLNDDPMNIGDNYGLYKRSAVTLEDGSIVDAIIGTTEGNLTWHKPDHIFEVTASQIVLPVEMLLEWKSKALANKSCSYQLEEVVPTPIFKMLFETDGQSEVLRRQCFIGINKFDQEARGIGKTYACTHFNNLFVPGETVKYMHNAEMTDNLEEIKNTLDVTDLCTCWDKNGQEGGVEKDCVAVECELGLREGEACE